MTATATTTDRAQGVEFLGGGLGWAPYGDEGHFYGADGEHVSFPTVEEAWAWVDQHNTPADAETRTWHIRREFPAAGGVLTEDDIHTDTVPNFAEQLGVTVEEAAKLTGRVKLGDGSVLVWRAVLDGAGNPLAA